MYMLQEPYLNRVATSFQICVTKLPSSQIRILKGNIKITSYNYSTETDIH